MTLPTQILLGLALGIGAGLFFGEPLGSLSVIGDAFIRLLQMTVLPYVVCSLIAGLGSLQHGVARELALRGGSLLLLLWALAAAMVLLMPLAFPPLETASFFSTTLVERRPPIDFLGLYIPSNPFSSMASNAVPAVVVFSIALGIALMGMQGRERLLGPLHAVNDALHRVSGFVVRLTPIGVFAIGASAGGTLTVDEFQRIQVYLVTYVLFALLMTLWVLPGLVSTLTPIRRRDVVGLSRAALITAFATGSEFIVLPLLADRSKQLLRGEEERPETDALVDVLVPVVYTFPHVAKVLSLSFVPFAAWFMDLDLRIWEYPTLLLTGIVTMFSSINVAMPFLLDLMRLPEDLFQLFVATSVVNARFGTLLGGMHILVLTVLATSALTGGYRWRWRSALRFAAITLLLVAGVVGGARLAFAVWIDTTYRKAEVIGEMQLLYDAAPAVVHREAGAIPAPKQAPGPDDGRNRVERIADRGTLRVCYPREDLLPFVFFNARDELVGLDVELAHSLAQGLEVSLEFVPVDDSFQARRVSEALVSDVCDIGMTRSPLSMIQHGRVDYSKPYLNVNWAFLVRDHRRHEFAFRDEFELRDDLRVAIPNDPYHVARMARHLPSAELVPVATVQDFLDAEEGAFDAMIYPAEAGSAWSLLRPEFAVVVPDPPFELLPASFLVPSGELAWLNTVNSWITLKQSDGTVQELYDYWILGRATERRAPRWSVIRNVLGWVD